MERLAPASPIVRVSEARLRNVVYVAVLTWLVIFGVFLYQMMVSDWTLMLVWVWALLGWVATIGLLRYIVLMSRWESTTISFGTDAMRFHRKGRLELEVPYESVSGYRFDAKEPGKWLMIERSEGRPTVVVSNYSVWGETDVSRTDFIRGLGPRLTETARQDRGERPDDAVDGYLFDHFGDPPAIPLQPGGRYRYMFPEALAKRVAPSSALSSSGIAFVQLPKALSDLARGRADGLTYGMIAVSLLGFTFAGWAVRRRYRLKVGFQDRLEIMPEGVRITRRHRSWIVRGPATVESGFFAMKFEGQPVLRFGPKWNPYYVDPRFLERDR